MLFRVLDGLQNVVLTIDLWWFLYFEISYSLEKAQLVPNLDDIFKIVSTMDVFYE